VQSLRPLAGKHATNLFVILQAALKAYLFRTTRQADLVIAILKFGRTNLPGLEDQIGPYAAQVAVRTVLAPEDTFDDVVRKVIFSNEEAETYGAYPYLIMLASKTPARPIDSFLKFRLQYSDEENDPRPAPPAEPASADGTAPGQEPPVVNMDVELDFIHWGEQIELQVVYDAARYGSAQIRELIDGYLWLLAEAAVVPAEPAH
jgi:non-ribosomal peptide synthetase component F